jgi:hypothetical protein
VGPRTQLCQRLAQSPIDSHNRKRIDILVPHLTNEPRRPPLLVHALSARNLRRVTRALLGLEGLEEGVTV